MRPDTKTRRKLSAPSEAPTPAPIEGQGPECVKKLFAAAEASTGAEDFCEALAGVGNPLTRRTQEVFGLKGHALARFLLSRQLLAFGDSDTDDAIAAFEAVANLAPRNAEQAMLATQMTQTFFLGCKLLRSAGTESNLEVCERRANLATKLSRLFLEQSSALARLQGRSTVQKIVVERLSVESGGQAAIGVLTSPPVDRRGRGGVSDGNV